MFGRQARQGRSVLDDDLRESQVAAHRLLRGLVRCALDELLGGGLPLRRRPLLAEGCLVGPAEALVPRSKLGARLRSVWPSIRALVFAPSVAPDERHFSASSKFCLHQRRNFWPSGPRGSTPAKLASRSCSDFLFGRSSCTSPLELSPMAVMHSAKKLWQSAFFKIASATPFGGNGTAASPGARNRKPLMESSARSSVSASMPPSPSGLFRPRSSSEGPASGAGAAIARSGFARKPFQPRAADRAYVVRICCHAERLDMWRCSDQSAL